LILVLFKGGSRVHPKRYSIKSGKNEETPVLAESTGAAKSISPTIYFRSSIAAFFKPLTAS